MKISTLLLTESKNHDYQRFSHFKEHVEDRMKRLGNTMGQFGWIFKQELMGHLTLQHQKLFSVIKKSEDAEILNVLLEAIKQGLLTLSQDNTATFTKVADDISQKLHQGELNGTITIYDQSANPPPFSFSKKSKIILIDSNSESPQLPKWLPKHFDTLHLYDYFTHPNLDNFHLFDVQHVGVYYGMLLDNPGRVLKGLLDNPNLQSLAVLGSTTGNDPHKALIGQINDILRMVFKEEWISSFGVVETIDTLFDEHQLKDLIEKLN